MTVHPDLLRTGPLDRTHNILQIVVETGDGLSSVMSGGGSGDG